MSVRWEVSDELRFSSGEVNLNYELTTLTQEDVARIFDLSLDAIAAVRADIPPPRSPNGGYLYCFRDNTGDNWDDAATWPKPLLKNSLEAMRVRSDILNHD